MKTVINLDDVSKQIVNRNAAGQIMSIEGTGVFDRLLTSLASFMELQEQNSKITQSQYAEILSQALPSVLGASIEFTMKSLVTAAEVDKAREEEQLVYVGRVAKDKEAALLGLDDVALNARQAQDGISVYTPAYTNGNY